MNQKARGGLTAYSAGSHPSGKVRPEALRQLEGAGIRTEAMRSKSWDEFATAGAPQMQFVITVCDHTANEACPFWPGQPITAHWGIPDPAAVLGSTGQIERAFQESFVTLDRRIGLFVALPFSALNLLDLQREIEKIGNS